METEGSLPSSQAFNTCLCPEPDQLPHSLPWYLFKISCIVPSTPSSFKWFLSLIFSHQNPVCISFLSHACHTTRIFSHPRFDNPNNIWRGIRIMKFLIMQFPSSCCFSSPYDITWEVEVWLHLFLTWALREDELDDPTALLPGDEPCVTYRLVFGWAVDSVWTPCVRGTCIHCPRMEPLVSLYPCHSLVGIRTNCHDSRTLLPFWVLS